MGDVVERTASSGDKAYLLGVEDPVSNFNATCPAANTAVFTYGMSQQGAHRWATGDQCGPFTSTVNSWSVQWTRPEQILFHYYYYSTISGWQPARRGYVIYAGRDITAVAPDQIVRAGIIQVPEGRRIFGPLIVLENLETGAFIRTDKQEIAEAWRMFFICSRV